MADETMTLEERVLAFMMMKLPGQLPMMHMGTSYLVNDLCAEIKRLESAIAARKVPDGIALIATERSRQLMQEGWTIEHDDEHAGGELALAAASYASGEKLPSWPWGDNWWKPSRANRIRELQKAGALIAAEIDRLLRKKDVCHER